MRTDAKGSDTMDVRPQRTIELSEYGMDSQIILEPLNFVRKKQLQNNLGRTTHFTDMNTMQLASQDYGDMMVYKAMAYIVKAPFKLNSIESFYNFMDRADRVRLGNGDALFDRINAEIESLSSGNDSPLQSSQEGLENPSSEQDSSQRA